MEEPPEIRVNGEPFTVTMRTPGHDLDLALGFLVAEGVVHRGDQVRSARHCPTPHGTPTAAPPTTVRLDPELIADLPARLRSARRVFDSTGGPHAAGLFTPV